MKKNLALLSFALLISSANCYADVPVIPSTPIPKVTDVQKPTSVSTSFENCVKTYNTNVDNLFLLTLAAINANNYKLDEIQSRTGYITFSANNKTFLASVTSINSQSSRIRITPADNSYAFSQFWLDKIFNYLASNIK